MVCKIDECEKIFVSWSWSVSVLVGLIVTIAALAWAGGSKLSQSDTRMENLESEVMKWNSVPSNLDTIKLMLRAKQ